MSKEQQNVYLMYEEKFFSIVIVVGWMILALSMIDTMVSVLVERSLDLFKINGEIVVNLCVSLISLLLVYIVGRMYKKNITKGLKTLGVGNLILLTILMAVDTYVVTVIAIMNVEINSEVYRNLYLVDSIKSYEVELERTEDYMFLNRVIRRS